MQEVRRLARKAAMLQWLADQYRERARLTVRDGGILRREAASLERMAAALLTSRVPSTHAAECS